MTAEQRAAINAIVWKDPERMSGEPCFRGTRVPVQTLLDHLQGNNRLNEFLADFPSVSREQAVQFIELGKDALLECVYVSC